MTLPKITHPTIELEIPSTKQKIKVRPMLTKEEKLLLMAKETQSAEEILSSVKQVVNNCIVTEGIDIDSLAIFDLEYLFIKLRSYSINNIVKVAYIDNEDQQNYEFEVNLDEVDIKYPDNEFKDKKGLLIKVDDNVSFQLRYPKASLYSNKDFMSMTGATMVEFLARQCIDTVYTKNSAHPFKDETEEAQIAFITDLPIKTYEKVREFLGSLPSLYHVIHYKNSKGSDRKIEMNTLNDFFTLA